MFDRTNYVLTSKGPRHRSQVHQLKGGSHIRFSDSTWRVRSRDTDFRQLITSPVSPTDSDQQAEGGWKSWADWRNTTGRPITTFTASWKVPPAPTKASGQLIYLFNGLQDAACNHIVQPVLQWGMSPAQGSGNFWGLASFWVGQMTEPMFCSEWVAVPPGTAVRGRMTLAAQNNGLFNCTCRFDGYPGTELTAGNLPELTDCVLTLEAYNTGPDAPYPNGANTGFSPVMLTTVAGIPTVNWTVYGAAVVKTDGGNGGNVEVVYPTSGT
jgi:hypothetical protein